MQDGTQFLLLWSMHSRWQTDRTSNQINTNIRNYIPPRKQRNRRKSNKGCTQTKVIRKDFFKEATFKFNLFSKQKSEGVFENQIRTTSLLHRTLQLLPILCRVKPKSLPENRCGCGQSCPTLCDPKEYSPSGSSVHGTGKNTGVSCHFLLQGIFLTQGSKLHLLPRQVDSFTTEALG